MTKYSDNLTNADVQAVLLALPDHAITGDEMCPCQNRRHAPDAVARLVKAARAGLNYLENTEGEFGITLGSATGLRAALAALAAMEASHESPPRPEGENMSATDINDWPSHPDANPDYEFGKALS